MPLVRSRSMPGVSLGQALEEECSSGAEAARDSGFAVGSEPPSFVSDPRSSMLGDAPFPYLSEPPSEVEAEKKPAEPGPEEDVKKEITIGRHYYPEGGWGWVVGFVCVFVNLIVYGLHQGLGVILLHVTDEFPNVNIVSAGWLGAMSTSIALFISPLTMAICRRKSTRLTAVLGGLVTALGCLFTSFASHYHQLFFSYGAIIGVGVGMTRDSSSLMVGQYFKRKREMVEIMVVSSSGLGISVMSAFVHGAVSSIGWRLGLQAVTGVVFVSFLLGTFYRSASLYHPQRRAILHLKNQKRKIKEKNRHDDKPPLFDLTTLKSRTIQILLFSISISSFGTLSPIIYLAHQAKADGYSDYNVLLLQTYLGLGWVVGCIVFGFLVVQRSSECRIGRQYLCQTALVLCGCVTAGLATVDGYHGYVLFSWLYGIFCGGFHYTLKMFTYEKVRARNFARTWGYVQCSQAIPIAIGVPISGYINVECGNKYGYYFSSTFIIVGSISIFLINGHRAHQKKHRSKHRVNDPKSNSKSAMLDRQDSLTHLDRDDTLFKLQLAKKSLENAELLPDLRIKPELTCISEEGIADMDLPDHMLDELECLGDCITSCDKVENYLMMSEYENNLGKSNDQALSMEKKGRRRLFSFKHTPLPASTLKPSPASVLKASIDDPNVVANGGNSVKDRPVRRSSIIEAQTVGVIAQPPIGGLKGVTGGQLTPVFNNQKSNLKSGNFRTISVIEEASV